MCGILQAVRFKKRVVPRGDTLELQCHILLTDTREQTGSPGHTGCLIIDANFDRMSKRSQSKKG
ncbi:hypothetical protein T265_11954 [Opisthorchis viverrini]|uniref:Uncharacterized protein n=1 Tax=Opisthorchis viverrini TaxID=6198 RepID=A0A074ZVL9_OPIVI|nr:hypothetical protein T265_11954 [Opisthorchis viverrini]KER19194.1 hypothetical protein T265_11954 [Opisthorchis viverrini]